MGNEVSPVLKRPIIKKQFPNIMLNANSPSQQVPKLVSRKDTSSQNKEHSESNTKIPSKELTKGVIVFCPEQRLRRDGHKKKKHKKTKINVLFQYRPISALAMSETAQTINRAASCGNFMRIRNSAKPDLFHQKSEYLSKKKAFIKKVSRNTGDVFIKNIGRTESVPTSKFKSTESIEDITKPQNLITATKNPLINYSGKKLTCTQVFVGVQKMQSTGSNTPHNERLSRNFQNLDEPISPIQTLSPKIKIQKDASPLKDHIALTRTQTMRFRSECASPLHLTPQGIHNSNKAIFFHTTSKFANSSTRKQPSTRKLNIEENKNTERKQSIDEIPKIIEGEKTNKNKDETVVPKMSSRNENYDFKQAATQAFNEELQGKDSLTPPIILNKPTEKGFIRRKSAQPEDKNQNSACLSPSILSPSKTIRSKKDCPTPRKQISINEKEKTDSVRVALINRVKKEPWRYGSQSPVKKTAAAQSSEAERKRIWKGENGVFKKEYLRNWYIHMKAA